MKRKKFKFILAVTFIAILGVNCLAGCGAKQEAAEENVLEEEQQEKDNVLSASSTSAPDPTKAPTPKPTAKPTEEPAPTPEPTVEPTPEPTPAPTEAPKEEKAEPEKPKEEAKETPKEEKPKEDAKPAEPEDKMAKYGFTKCALNKEYEYTSLTYDNRDVYTTGTVEFTDYSRKDLGNGYDEVSVMVTFRAGDENARKYGIALDLGIKDAYTHEEGVENVAGVYEEYYSLVYNGTTYDQCINSYTVPYGQWDDHVYVQKFVIVMKMPSQYKGLCIWVTGRGKDESYYGHLSQSPTIVSYFLCNK